MIPCVGAGITVVVKDGNWRGEMLRKVYVSGTITAESGTTLHWKSGGRTGAVFTHDEDRTWFYGHGPQARAAFLAAKALR